MLLSIHPKTPNERECKKAIEILQKDGIIIIPTDTIYAIACKASNKNGIERICKLIGKKPEKANLSLLCSDLSHLSDFCQQINNPIFRMMKTCLPGAFTFILNANNNVPKIFKNSSKKTIGIRVPDCMITRTLVQMLDEPLVSASLHSTDLVEEYLTDPELIHEAYEDQVDAVIDGGTGGNIPSTVVDCTGDEPELIRQGKGELP